MFKPNPQKRFLVVLDFRLDGGCHSPGNTQVRLGRERDPRDLLRACQFLVC